MSLNQIISGTEILSSANSEEGKKSRYHEDIDGIAIRAFPKVPLEISRWIVAEYIGKRSSWEDYSIFCEESPIRRLLLVKKYLEKTAHEMHRVAPYFSEEMNWNKAQEQLAFIIRSSINHIF